MRSRFPILCLAACGLATLAGPAGAENALEKLKAQIEQAARRAPARTATPGRGRGGADVGRAFGQCRLRQREGTARIAAAIPAV